MSARLIVFVCLMTMTWVSSLFIARVLRVRFKNWIFDGVIRVAVAVIVVAKACFPLFLVFLLASYVLVGGFEQRLVVAIGAVQFAIAIRALVVNLRAPRIEGQEFRRNHRALPWYLQSAPLLVLLGILLCGALAWLWGRHAFLVALEKAAVPARVELDARLEGTSAEAFLAYDMLHINLPDEERPRSSHDKEIVGEKLARTVDEHRQVLDRLEQLLDGPKPRIEPETRQLFWNGLDPVGRLSPDSRLLLGLAAREAAQRNDGDAFLHFLNLRLKLGEHTGAQPGQKGFEGFLSAAVPGSQVLARGLPAVGPGQRDELARYLETLTAMRRSLPARVLQARKEEVAIHAIVMRDVMKGSGRYRECYWEGWWLTWLWPLYGQDAMRALPGRVSAIEAALTLPIADAQKEVIGRDKERRVEDGTIRFALWMLGTDSPQEVLLRRIRSEQYLSVRELACALRLYALDNGSYPESLSELGSKYVDPEILKPDGAVRVVYKREGVGFRLTWHSWMFEEDGGLVPDSRHTSEMAVGVPLTPEDVR